MSPRHHYRRLLALSLATAAATTTGCQPNPKPPVPTTQSSALSPQSPPLPTTNPSDDSAAALARKAEAWSKMLEAIQAHRTAAATNPTTVVATTQPATQPSTQPSADWQRSANAARLPASRPLTATTAPAATPAPSPTASALVFTPPPTTAPAATTQTSPTPATHPTVVAPPPKIIVKDALAERTLSDVKNSPRDPAVNLNYQLVRFLQDQQSPDLSTLSPLPADDRESIAALLDALTNYRAALRSDPNGLASKKVQPLLALADRLRASADLQIPTATLCTTVRGFGSYDPLRAPLAEGRENRALLYTEVSGFASRLADDGQWETKLSEELVLYRGDVEVWRKPKVDQITDHCRNRRRDFYTINLIQLPSTLPAAPYTLKVTLIDQIANRVAETTVPVTIVSPNLAGATGK